MKKVNDNMDMCDIMIEKRWRDIMNTESTNEGWEEVLYSKNQINKAGKVISNLKDAEVKEIVDALKVLNNWRAAHAYPLHVITSNLRRSNKNAIVVQRLKRLDSIVGKLERFPHMSLYGMQDLGGCRVIVNDIDDVYKSLNKYKNSRIRHILKREDDYISHPKESGYRSYHMVYKFQSDKTETYNRNMLIEIQFRTNLQHTWATAVEMMGVYTKSQLKASMGDEDVLRFFSLVSSVFAIVEETPVVPNTSENLIEIVDEIKEIDFRCNIVNRLSAINVAIRNTKKEDFKGGYYILKLNYGKRVLSIYPFKPSQIEQATHLYNEIEELNDNNIDAVLISANSMESVRAAYPNYFADIEVFVETMRKLLEL
ncbi:MAG: RelA/SpoT domain-containing protein [Eubacterium sp.]